MGVSGIFDTVPYKTGLGGEQIVAIIWAGELAIKQWRIPIGYSYLNV